MAVAERSKLEPVATDMLRTAPTQTATMSANSTAYSTDVGPSSATAKRLSLCRQCDIILAAFLHR